MAPLESVIGPCDLLHGTDHFLPPHRCPKRIYTSHDLIAISRPDLTSDFHRRYVEAQLPAWQRPGSFFISVSEFTRREMTRLVGLPSERIRVIPNAVSAEFRPVQGSGDRTRLEAFRAAHGLSRRFLLAVANTNLNKNLVNLLRAVRIVLERTSAVDQLVLCGNQGWPRWAPPPGGRPSGRPAPPRVPSERGDAAPLRRGDRAGVRVALRGIRSSRPRSHGVRDAGRLEPGGGAARDRRRRGTSTSIRRTRRRSRRRP